MPADAIGYVFNAELVRVVDGDTLRVRVDLGFCIWHLITVRLHGIDCPEMGTDAGVQAKVFTTWWLNAHAVNGFKVFTKKQAEHQAADKYGRWLATIENRDGRSLTADLLTEGYAVPWSR